MSGPRKSFGRGQMTRGANSGPAIMMMPPHIRATFMPNPPLKQILPLPKKRRVQWTGMSEHLDKFEKGPPPKRAPDRTPSKLKAAAIQKRAEEHKADLQPLIAKYRQEQKESSGEFEGMNCYNTLFIGRLAYEVTERKLLRELEVFGPVKDLKLIKDREGGKSRGYAFCEFEHEEDMKRAYRAADGMRLEGREIVVDVERGHTVPNWLPRRLGGGLGGTRLGGKDENILFPGRFDPSKKLDRGAGGMGRGMPPPQGGFGRGGGPAPPPFGGAPGMGGSFGRGSYGGPPARGNWERSGPPPPRYGDRDHGPPGGSWDRKRPLSRSPERRHSSSRRRH